jgi:hypothetical protein
MKIIDLGKLRFHFAGAWSISTQYEVNDVVKYGSNVYVYINPVKATGNLPTDEAYWALMVSGFNFRGVYDPATQYLIGDGVAFGAKVFICIEGCTGVATTDASKWSQFADGISWEGDYSGVTAYQQNDVVKYGTSVYIATQSTVGNAPTDTTFWAKFIEGVSTQGVYNAGTTYQVGDLVAYGTSMYKSLAINTGITPSSDPAKWLLFVPGMRFADNWSTATLYYKNDFVVFDNAVYIALAEHTAGVFATDLAAIKWKKFVSGLNFSSAWTTATSYKVNDIVTYGGNSYIALTTHNSTTFASDLAATKWAKFNSGIAWRGNWTAFTAYKPNDLVYDGNMSTYIVLTDHTSASVMSNDIAANRLSIFARGSVAGIPAVTSGTRGKPLMNDGTNTYWGNPIPFTAYIDMPL